MTEHEFAQKVVDELRKIPVAERRSWRGSDLMGWWFDIKSTNTYLTIKGFDGDLWQRVSGICQDMIGEGALH